MNNVKRICVFASSSNYLDDKYYKSVTELGSALGQNGFDVVYGGSNLGLMWTCAKSAKDNGSKIYGVMPEKLHNILGEKSSEICDELYITDTMRSRKAKLDEISDAVIAVPGGFGTLEELSEMIVQKQLGYNAKPIIIYNTDNFYGNLINFFEKMINEHYANPDMRTLYYVCDNAYDVINYLKNYVPQNRIINKKTVYKR
ncbi:TIGR00730 family Rossman fold protein [bacterium]|nr:TIGR00730 family Rossman fold protein [bacterium]